MTNSLEDRWTQLQTSFETACAAIRPLGEVLQERPLRDFVRPVDRCIPEALAESRLGDVVLMSFAELRSLGGVGQVKIGNLVDVLRRIVVEAPQLEAAAAHAPPTDAAAHVVHVAPTEIDELRWEQWRARVRAHNLGGEFLGRFVESLRELRRGLWFAPLDDFLDLSLAELHRQRGFGPKRIGAIIQVFQLLDELLVARETDPNRPLLLGPWRIAVADAYLAAVAGGLVEISTSEFERSVVLPVLEQIDCDAGEATYAVVAERIGVDPLHGTTTAYGEPRPTVSSHERFSRPYRLQLLTDAATLLQCRWPRGEQFAAQVVERLQARPLGVAQIPLATQTFAALFPNLKADMARSRSQRAAGKAKASAASLNRRSAKDGLPGLRTGA